MLSSWERFKMKKEILNFCVKKGLLLDEDTLNLFNETEDIESVKLILEKIKNKTHQRIITKNIFNQNKNQINELFLNIPKENKKSFEKLKIKLGLSIEISKEVSVEKHSNDNLEKESIVKIESHNFEAGKKLTVKDFVASFKKRFIEMKDLLQSNPSLNNLTSINKISGNRQGISIIGIISSKRITKNKNLMLEVEDLTGKIKVIINQNNSKLFEKAEDICLDSVIGFKGSGNSEIFFVKDFVFPEAMIVNKKKAPIEEFALFIGDLHYGSKKFLEKSFLKFIDYLNGKIPNTPEVKKIKYLFLVGDLITGVGNYPNQERDLKIKDLEEQFSGVANLLGKIRKDIKIIISPGNHDCVRLMEPQPTLDEKYAWKLYNMKNVFLTENPCYVNIASKGNFPGFEVLTYHGFSFPFYANNVPKLIKKNAMNSPEEIMKFLLMQRHLAPTHKSNQYFPSELNSLFIRKVPDIFVAAHTHKGGITTYNNILVISVSCWEAMTTYQEKFGNKPDHCKVPILNLKTRQIKILDFEEKNEEEKGEKNEN